jgi:predicted adenine nucleotide alpha hydrolase (AANH) superfamily ATPase
MKILLHICCAPCTIYPLQNLRDQQIEIQGYFHNPNIHPYREYEKRLQTLRDYARLSDLEIIFSDQYNLEDFLDQTRPWGPERCRTCYRLRLESTAGLAKDLKMDSFTTTLLYSRFQKHEWIRDVGFEVAERYQIHFFYQDFRPGWTEGVKKSKELGLYRQPYCGCIFSEKERFAPRSELTNKKNSERLIGKRPAGLF